MKKNKSKIEKLITIVLVFVMIAAGMPCLLISCDFGSDYSDDDLSQNGLPNDDSAQIDEPEQNDSNDDVYLTPSGELLDAFYFVDNMRVGWNLGNTFDSIDNRGRGIRGSLEEGITPEEHYETYWGNPVTTREMINAVVDAGFGAIRIPVTYTDHMDENFQIRTDWLLRVEQVVNYVMDAGAYCIINIHHDTGSGSWPWLKADPDNIEELSGQLNTVWTQIAEHFKDYSDELLFEGFNEILDVESRWNNSDNAAFMAVNQLNQVFVDTVRATGGNNSNRVLIVKTYAAGTDQDILDAFILPSDSVEYRLIVSVHTYVPHAFTWTEEKVSWTQTHSDWSQTRDAAPVEDIMDRLHATFVQNRIPVMIGEFGAMNKNNTADRVNYAVHFVETAKSIGITCFWWDDGGSFADADSVDSYALLDRYTMKWFFPEIAKALVEAGRR